MPNQDIEEIIFKKRNTSELELTMLKQTNNTALDRVV